jgi:Zn-dependent protease/CBS domain-containing protein
MKRFGSIALGRVFGIPLFLDYSWFLIFALLTWLLAAKYYPVEIQGWSTALYWVLGAVTAILLFVSVLLHELSHSVVAMQYKINVRQITLFIFGGVSDIAGEPTRPSAEFWIAIAGPFMSFAIAIVSYLIMLVVQGSPPLYALMKYMAFINVALGVFNLIPGFPLDGGRVLRSIIWAISHNASKATSIAATVGRVFAWILIIVGGLEIFGGQLINGLWIAFIGWFLESAAVQQSRQQVFHDMMQGHLVDEATQRDMTTVPSDTTIQNLVDHHILGTGRRAFIVEHNGEKVGLLTLHAVREIPRDKWTTTTVHELMIPEPKVKTVDAKLPLWDAIMKMDQDGVNQMPVLQDGKIVGILSRESTITFLRTLQELNM